MTEPRQVYPGIYLCTIPMPNNPLKGLNSYYIPHDGGGLIVDAGFNLPVCKAAVGEYLEYLHMDPCKTRLFLTHAHSDHAGLAHWMSELGMEVLAGRDDKYRYDNFYPTSHECYWELYEIIDVDKDIFVSRKHEEHPFEFFPYTRVWGGQTIEVGDFCFRIVDIPGHTEGHLCLYEESRKIMISGDHILDHISPNITCLGFGNPLGSYLNSLDQTAKMDIKLLLPAHRGIMGHPGARIEELKAHHEVRLAEIMERLKAGEQTCEEISRHLTWHISKALYDMPTMQIFCAMGETLAHTEYLYHSGRINRRVEGKTYYYSLKDSQG